MYFNEIGNLLLSFVFALSFIQFFSAIQGCRTNNIRLISFSNDLTKIMIVLIVTSFLCLVKAFLVTDFSNQLVYLNSSEAQPLIYKITASFGNHEGSMLLWNLMLILFTFIFSFNMKKIPINMYNIFICCQTFLILAFSAYLLFFSNPFERLFPPALEGKGLNPLLQDLALVFHPPILYLGYLSSSVVFSLSIAALYNKYIDDNWLLYIKKWVYFSWSMLTLGIGIGSFWAYYELGWGGFWFWDPVENVSLLPWLLLTGMIHNIILINKRKVFKKVTILFGVLSFVSAILGTFIVRSGVITSVHSFAENADRGIFILLILLALIFVISYFAYKNIKYFYDEKMYDIISKDMMLVINNVFVIAVFLTIVIGVFYPLIIETITGDKISIGEPFYNNTASIIMLISCLLIGFSQKLNWEKDNIRKFILSSKYEFIFNLLLFILVSYYVYNNFEIKNTSSNILLYLTIFVLLNIMVFSISHYIKFKKITSFLGHMGLAILMIGVIGNKMISEERTLIIEKGKSYNYKHLTLKINDIDIIKKSNYYSKFVKIDVFDNNEFIFSLSPEERIYDKLKKTTIEAAISNNFGYDLYLNTTTIIEDDKEKIVLNVFYKPFSKMLWVGVIVLFLSGLLMLFRRK